MQLFNAMMFLLAVSVEAKYHCGRDAPTLCPNGDCNLETGICSNCADGISGYNCEVVTAEMAHADCDPNPCKNGGTCWKGASTSGMTKCLCTELWTGDTCTERRYELSCTYAGDGSMSMTIRPQGEVNGVIYLKDKDPETDTSCVFSGNPPSLLALSHNDGTCGPATEDGTKLKREVLILFEDGRMSSQDEIVTFICGESDTVEISADGGVDVNALDASFLAVTKSLAPLTEDLDLQLLVGDTPAGTVTIGTLITLEVDLTAPGANKFEGILLETCMAGTHADPEHADYVGSYFIQNYCPSTDLDDVMLPEVTVDGTSITFQFVAFKFTDSDSLFIRCSVEPCENAADCAPAVCGDKKRKKREAGTQMTSLQRSINITDPLAIAALNQQLKSNTPCYQTWEMTATVVALAVALVIVLFICIILVVKVITSRKSDQGMSYRGDLSETSSTAHFPNLPTIVSNKC